MPSKVWRHPAYALCGIDCEDGRWFKWHDKPQAVVAEVVYIFNIQVLDA